MEQRKSGQAGYSLVELLAAVVILAVGLLGLAELQIAAIKTNAQSDAMTVANGIAQKVVEQIAAMAADEDLFKTDKGTPAGDDPVTWTGVDGVGGSPYDIPGAGVYHVTFDIDADHEGVTGLSQVTIYVSSDKAVASVLGPRKRELNVVTFKRSF